MMDYYLDSEKPISIKTSIYGDGYVIKCNSGFYEPRNKQGIFVDNASIDFDSREIYGDSIFFDEDEDTQAFQITSKSLTQMKTLFLMVSLLSFFRKKIQL